MKKIHTIVRYLEICDGNMQEGSFRCDANVSLRKKTQKELGTRTELKNLNSFRFVEKAINYEIERQSDVLEQGRKIIQETRLYDSDLDETRSMRNKEEANDYRYFPDPDLLPIEINKDYISLRVTRGKDDYPESLEAPGVPTTYFLDNKGNPIIRKVMGYWNIEDYLSFLDDVDYKLGRKEYFE
jgi:aspartyl-tRNA(Asn)/glutamyl-tRNA(Gln) amidotransferase subunit B